MVVLTATGLAIAQYLPHAVPFFGRAICGVAGFAVLYGTAAACKSLRGQDGMGAGDPQNVGRHWEACWGYLHGL